MDALSYPALGSTCHSVGDDARGTESVVEAIRADSGPLIAVDGDPLAGIRQLEQVAFVMQRGLFAPAPAKARGAGYPPIVAPSKTMNLAVRIICGMSPHSSGKPR